MSHSSRSYSCSQKGKLKWNPLSWEWRLPLCFMGLKNMYIQEVFCAGCALFFPALLRDLSELLLSMVHFSRLSYKLSQIDNLHLFSVSRLQACFLPMAHFISPGHF
jgi:hypothetical protein